MSGLEIESRQSLTPNFSGVVVARVMSISAHPGADRLRVCQVDAGTGELLQIVCGASNVTVDSRVPCAMVGGSVGELTIKAANLRGIASNGMLCSAKELGLSDDAAGLLILPSDAPIGMDVAQYLDLDDIVTTLKLTPNRGDCLSMAGIAREVSALTGAPVTKPEIKDVPVAFVSEHIVRIEDSQACGLYCGRVINLSRPNAATPQWMKARLDRAGLRAISAVVDVTNYVMIEFGQPLHGFDNDKLTGDIVVRFAKAGESLRLLNGQDVNLTPDVVVITDRQGPIALGGIMGGLGSSMKPVTRSIFLEAAFFPPAAIASRARRLGLTSDAAYRFERGVDYGNTKLALERATQLIVEICGGEVGGISYAQAELPSRDAVLVRPNRIERVLGIRIEEKEIREIFSKLECGVQTVELGLLVTPPTHRFDLTIDADFIEEIARVHGYDNIPTAPQLAETALLPQPQRVRDSTEIAKQFVSRDYQEILTYSFVDPEWERDFSPERQPIAIRNPISQSMAVMRTTLLGGLIETLRFNLNRKQERVRIFEIGRCFLPTAKSDQAAELSQPRRVSGLCYGNRHHEQWGEHARVVDYFDVKADLEAIFHNVKLTFKKSEKPILHPGKSASLTQNGHTIGYIGELHPQLCQKYGLPSVPIIFELDLDPLLATRIAQYQELSKFPNVRRDIAVVIDDHISAQEMIDSLYSSAPASVRDIQLFDQYRGENVGIGKKSLAFRVVMNDTEKTLTEEEIEKIDQSLKQTLVSLHQAQLRS